MSKDSEPSSSRATGSGAFQVAPVVLDGIPGSPGYAIGSAIVLDLRRPGVARRHIPKHLAAEELERFDRAVELASAGLKQAAEGARARGMRAELGILDAYILMVEDDTLRTDVERRIAIDKVCADWALVSAIDDMAGQLGESADSYLAERKHDIEFAGNSILRALTGRSDMITLPEERPPGIIVAHDLSPAETAGLTKDRVLAIATEGGTRTSHTAIVARALDIPAVVGIPGLLSRIGDGDRLIIDGVHGRVTLHPDSVALQEGRELAERYRVTAATRRELRDVPVATRCGVPIELKANIELPDEAEIALQQGARGIGLYRTEFLYINRATPPEEEEQYQIYKRVVEVVKPYPVTVRTFDIGGDKSFGPYSRPHEANPALGMRAIRLGLAKQDLFLTQFRAILRASAHGNLRVMVPMVASLAELRRVKTLFEQALSEVDASNQPRAATVPLGIMVEVPSAAIMADRFADQADFLSIGTNDLVQYSLAVDRSSPELAHLASGYDPAILRLIRGVVKAGAEKKRPVLVCGAMASDPLAAVLLIGLGLRELSLEASALPDVREIIAQVTLAEAEEAAAAALECMTAEEAEYEIRSRFGSRLSQT